MQALVLVSSATVFWAVMQHSHKKKKGMLCDILKSEGEGDYLLQAMKHTQRRGWRASEQCGSPITAIAKGFF